MSEDFKKISAEELEKVAGGRDGKVGLDMDGPWVSVTGLKTGWLALREQPVYDYSNEIGHLYNGNRVQIIGNGSGDSPDGRSYVWVYSPDLNKSGWVNSSFLTQPW